jgi:N utilization substance protein A
LAIQEADLVPQIEAILAKKDEGRPITPEEYHTLGSFVDRVERGVIEKRQAVKREYAARLKMAEEAVPAAAYDLPLEALGLATQTQNLLQEEEYENVGDLMLQLNMDSNVIREISGIGPKAMEEIESAIEAITSIMPKDEEPEPEIEAEAEPVDKVEEPEAVEAEGVTEEPEAAEVTEEVDETPEPEAIAEAEVEAEPEGEAKEVEEAAEEELPESLEEIFTIRPEMLDVETVVDEEELEEIITPKKRSPKKKKKTQKKYVDIEYDPDADVTLYRKRHKRDDGDDWEEDWDY